MQFSQGKIKKKDFREDPIAKCQTFRGKLEICISCAKPPFQNKPFISFIPPIQRKLLKIVGHVSAAHDPSRLQEKGNKQEGEERTSWGNEANIERTEHSGTERTGGLRESKGKKTDTIEERIQRK